MRACVPPMAACLWTSTGPCAAPPAGWALYSSALVAIIYLLSQAVMGVAYWWVWGAADGGRGAHCASQAAAAAQVCRTKMCHTG